MANPIIGKKWENTKNMFFEMTQKKKPKEKLGGLLKTSHTGLSKSMEEVDKAWSVYDNARIDLGNDKITLEQAQKTVANFEAKHQAYVKAMNSYLQTLDKEIKVETQKEADVKSVWERGLKFLRKELSMYDAVIKQHHASAVQSLDAKRKLLSTEDKQVDVWYANMESALKKAEAAIGKIKALAAAANGKSADIVKKVVKEYNSSIPGARGRDVCMQLVIAERVGGLRGTPDKIKQQMLPWNTANAHKLPDTATAVDVANKVKLFSTDIKAAVDWFGKATTK